MEAMARQYQAFQHNDQLVHGWSRVFYVYVLYNHENSNEKNKKFDWICEKKKKNKLYKLNDTFDIENFFYTVALNDLLVRKMNYRCQVKNLSLVISMVTMQVLLKMNKR